MAARCWRSLGAAVVGSVVLLLAASANAQDPGAPGSPEWKVMERFIGKWNLDLVQHPAEWTPKETRSTGTTVNEWVLGRRFQQHQARRNPGAIETFEMFMYDPQKKCYRHWHFDSQGSTLEMSAQWDPATTTMNYQMEPLPGFRGDLAIRFIDKDNRESTFVVKDQDGKVYLNLKGKMTRDKGVPPPAVKGVVAPPPPKPQELMLLERYLGTWDTETHRRAAEWTPKPSRTTGTVTNAWVLDGRFMQQKGAESDGREHIQMRTFDPQKKQYRVWHFDSAGFADSLDGQWNETARTMTWQAERNGITTTNRVHFPDNDTISWHVLARSAKGKVFSDMEGKFKRRR